jgi:hypothetical protein
MNLLLAIAALLTIWLGIFYCLPLPAGPDRAMIGLGCVFTQTPRWICMLVILEACVTRGAFAWPEDRNAQYVVVFLVHLLIGLGAICAGLAGIGVTAGVSTWLSRLLALSTILVPTIQIVFCFWFLNPRWHRTLDPMAARNFTNTSLIIFTASAFVFGMVGIAAWIGNVRHTARSRA